MTLRYEVYRQDVFDGAPEPQNDDDCAPWEPFAASCDVVSDVLDRSASEVVCEVVWWRRARECA